MRYGHRQACPPANPTCEYSSWWPACLSQEEQGKARHIPWHLLSLVHAMFLKKWISFDVGPPEFWRPSCKVLVEKMKSIRFGTVGFERLLRPGKRPALQAPRGCWPPQAFFVLRFIGQWSVDKWWNLLKSMTSHDPWVNFSWRVIQRTKQISKPGKRV